MEQPTFIRIDSVTSVLKVAPRMLLFRTIYVGMSGCSCHSTAVELTTSEQVDDFVKSLSST